MDKKFIIKRRVSTFLDLIFNYKLAKSLMEVKNYTEEKTNTNNYQEKQDNIKKENLYFRGENSKHDFRTPSLYREKSLVFEGSEYYYRILLNELGRDDYLENSSLVRLISELQHYGAKTRMLDVSKSPLIALFFASQPNGYGKDENGNWGPLDTEDGYVYIYKSEMNEKFDTGHTIAIKSACNFIEPNILNKFFESMEVLEVKYSLDLNYKEIDIDTLIEFNVDSGVIKDVIIFIEQLNQRAKTREKLKFPFKIYDDLKVSHIVLPSKSTDRIRQQQGAFIYPNYVNTSTLNLEEVQKKINDSINILATKIIDINNAKQYDGIRIEKAFKKVMRQELEQLGITKGFIFPDILNQSEALLEIYNKKVNI